MSKKHFIALADAIKAHNRVSMMSHYHFTAEQLDTLARVCRQQNGMFNRERWLAYIAGDCGPNGGRPKK